MANNSGYGFPFCQGVRGEPSTKSVAQDHSKRCVASVHLA